MSSEEDTEDVQPEGSEEKKGEKKKRKKKKRRSQSVEVSPKKSPVKLNEVQVIKKPPADAVPEREKRFEQIKAAYHLRDQTSTNLHEIPAPSHTEAKAESLARFLKRNSKPAIPTGVIDIPTSTRFDESVARQPTSLSPSKSSKSSPKAQVFLYRPCTPPFANEMVHALALLCCQERTNKVIGFNNRHSSNEAKLVDIGASEREEAASHLMLQPRAAVTQIVSENSPSKAAEARSASLPTPQTLGQQPGKSQSSYRSLCIDDTDENIMDDILLDT